MNGLDEYDVVEEGITKILVPKNNSVFYNKVQEFNRDLSVLTLYNAQKHISDDMKGNLKVLDAFSASGLRAIRYSQQVPNVKEVYANDLDIDTKEIIEKNISYSGVDPSLIKITISDAKDLMYGGKKFDVIDIDPYGSSSPFMDAVMQSIESDGIVCCTCTDMAVLCGVHPGTCFARYQGMPLHCGYAHEVAIRLVLSSLESSANKYHKSIEPLLSVKIDFYVRVFVRVRHSKLAAKSSFQRKALAYSCTICSSFYIHRLGSTRKNQKTGAEYAKVSEVEFSNICEICGSSSLKIGGPMWSEGIQDKNFIGEMINVLKEGSLRLGTEKRLFGFLTMLLEELDVPLFMYIPHMAKILHCPVPSLKKVISAFKNAGYASSVSHCKAFGIKSNAPITFIWDILKSWANNHKEHRDRYKDDISVKILSSPIRHNIDFTINDQAMIESRTKKMLRFHAYSNWGPMTKASRHSK